MILVSIVSTTETGASVVPLGTYARPKDPSMPWLLPRHRDEATLVSRLTEMPTRLVDLGFYISTGPLVWNRRKHRFCSDARSGAIPVLWAEAIAPNGRFTVEYQKRDGLGWFLPETSKDDSNIVTERVGLLQRTTAKEQPRRLIAAAMTKDFFRRYPRFTVENHVNMIRSRPGNDINIETIVTILNSSIVDRAFRCVSGSVAVSAFELEYGLPMPKREPVLAIQRLMQTGATSADLDVTIRRSYGSE
jgi:adenine-specific DNA-methyltransferase